MGEVIIRKFLSFFTGFERLSVRWEPMQPVTEPFMVWAAQIHHPVVYFDADREHQLHSLFFLSCSKAIISRKRSQYPVS
jgi:hypothetical protein